MPEISRFQGIVISMNWREHGPPHFHVRYGSLAASITLGGLRFAGGVLPPRVRREVTSWAAAHAAELAANWRLARRMLPLHRIAPDR